MKKNLLIKSIEKSEVHVEEIYCVINNHYSDLLNIQTPVINNLTFYRKPKINLSRHKVDLLKENKGISITRKATNANYTIISEEYLKDLYHTRFRTYPIKKFANFKILLDGAELPKSTLTSYNEYLIARGHGRIPFIDYIEYTSGYLFPPNIISTPYVTDVHMNAACDQYLKVLDNEDLENIENLIEGATDLTLVMEMLANCNASKSADIIGYILCKYGGKLSTCKAYNHVNFKALKSKFRYYTNSVYKLRSISYIIQRMADDSYLTKFILNVLVQDYIKYMKKSYMQDGIIKIKQITIDEKIKSKIIELRNNETENV